MEKMDRNIMSKMKRWIDAIAAEEIAGLIAELLEFISSDVSDKTLNKVLFKLLQHLSHAAYKFQHSKKKLGGELCRLSSLLCISMCSVPDSKKFFASIYHIVACLTEMTLYFEAMEISNYLLPTAILWKNDISTTEKSEIYEQISVLWYKASTEFLKATKLSTREDYDLFVKIVKYQLDLTKLTHENYSRNLLSKIVTYWKKTRDVFWEKYRDLGNEFKLFLLDYIKKNDIRLEDEDAPRTWRLICELIPILIGPTFSGQQINSTNVLSMAEMSQSVFDIFRPSIQNKNYYLDFYNFLENLYKTFFRPVENFSRDAINELVACTIKLDKFSRMEYLTKNKTEYDAAIPWYTYAAVTMLACVLHYWQKTAKIEETRKYVTDEMLVEVLSLSKKHEELFDLFIIETCPCDPNCKVMKDHYNIGLLNLQCLALMSNCPNSMSNENLSQMTAELANKMYTEMENMKTIGCHRWKLLWPSWGVHVYNISVSCESRCLGISAKLYECMYRAVPKISTHLLSEPRWGFTDSMGTILHRLFSVYMRMLNYERAEFVCAINGILSYENFASKAYRDWSTIKHKYVESADTTMLQYLRINEREVGKIIGNFSLEQEDLDMLCLREIKGHEESYRDMSRSIMNVLDEHARMYGKSLIYCQGVNLLGHHLFDHQESFSTIVNYIDEAKRLCRLMPHPCITYRTTYAMLEFYEFMIELQYILKKTENEMKSSQFGQYPSVVGGKTHENGRQEMKNIVPAYSTINMKVTSDLAKLLKISLDAFSRLMDDFLVAELNTWEFVLVNQALLVAGEYARLYHFQDLEIFAWELAYQSGITTRQDEFVVYATARRLTSDNVDLNWITHSNELVEALDQEQANQGFNMKLTLIYRLCLANFYYENNKPELGKKLLMEVEKRVVFLTDLSIYLLKLEIEMNYCLGQSENDDQTKYTCMIVQYLYTILSMDDTIDIPNGNLSLQFRLYDQEILLDFTNNLAFRMNGLLSYREITAHLVRRLRTAQKLCLPLRIAECLKFLCYLDLSRAQLEECESKLEGLEHILEIEAFGVTMRSQAPQAYRYNETYGRLNEPVRDLGQNDASPVLRKKVFAKPDFMLHGYECACFKCTNTRYQYLVFACTHIRAQLFSLQRNKQAAMQHFHGALSIKRDILRKENSKNDYRRGKTISSSCSQRDAIEWIMLHVDYCRFLKWAIPTSSKERSVIAQDALELCEKYILKNHPIFMAVKELLFEYRFEQVFTRQFYSKFVAPDINDIDVSRYNQETLPDPSICVTPVREIISKPAISVRRRKTPPFLKLDRVPNDLADDDSPMINSQAKRTRPIRRKISEDEDYSEDEQEMTTQRKKPSQKPITVDEPKINATMEGKRLIEVRENSIVTGSSSIFKGSKSFDKEIIKVEKIEELTNMVEALDVNSPIVNSTLVNSTRRRLRRRVPRSSESDLTSKKIDESTKVSTQVEIRQKSSRARKPTIKTNELNVIDLTLDVATTSANDSDLPIRRGSSRLRKKLDDSGKTSNS